MVAQHSRARLHEIVDALPEAELADAEQLLTSFASADPAMRAALLAPVDDEEPTDSELGAIERSKREIAEGDYVSDDDLDQFLPDIPR
jgi:hypothetical protein